MHPTMERLWLFKTLTGTMADLTWVGAEGAEAGEQMVSIYSQDCVGHRGDDVYPFDLMNGTANEIVRTGLVDTGAAAEIGVRGPIGNTLTNRDLLKEFDPRQNSLKYIYDTFRWDHCWQSGFNFDDAWIGAGDATDITEQAIGPDAKRSHSGSKQR